MDTKALRQKILDLAIRGKLVPQDPNDEPASVLLERIREEKLQMVADGRLKKKDIKNDTIIYRGEDNLHYEKFQDGTVKCIEDDIPFEVPEGWEWCRLGTIALYKKGPFGSSITKAMFVPDSPENIKIYEQKNAIGKDATLGEYYITPKKYEALKGFEVKSGDIIVSCAGTIGETFILPQNIRKGIINQALMRISMIDTTIIDFYLMYFDFVLKENAKKEGHGIALTNIPALSVLKNYVIPIPPSSEQFRIMDYLRLIDNFIDKINSSKEKLVEEIAALKEKILDLAIQGKLVPQNPDDEPASVLLDRIRSEKEELIKTGKIKRDKKESIIYRGEDNSYYEKFADGTIENIDNEIPFDLPNTWDYERLKNIVVVNPKNEIPDDTDVSFIPMTLIADQYSGIFEYEKRKWETCKKGFTHFAEGDVAFAKISPCFENRKSVFFDKLVNGHGAGTTELYILRFFNGDIDPYYMLNLIKSKYFISRGKGTFSGVVGQQRVNKDIIFNTLIPIPPASEQIKIVKQKVGIMNHLEQIEAALI